MADFKGGRGKKTGYQTEMYRIPSPVRPVIEKLGMQFRLLWDGVSDPKGEKLISRIESAIPDCDEDNLISGNKEMIKPDSKYKDEEDTEEVELDEPDQSDEQTIRDQATKNFKLMTENRMLDRELSEVRSRVEDLEADRDGWQGSAEQWAAVAEHNQELGDVARKELAELRSQLASCRELEKDGAEQLAEEMRNGFKAADILKEALKLKAGNGGAIKVKIKEALQLIDDI